MAFKYLREVALIGNANFQCHLSEWQVGFFKQSLSDFKTLTQDKLMGAFSCRLAEEAGEVVWAEADLLGEHF